MYVRWCTSWNFPCMLVCCSTMLTSVPLPELVKRHSWNTVWFAYSVIGPRRPIENVGNLNYILGKEHKVPACQCLSSRIALDYHIVFRSSWFFIQWNTCMPVIYNLSSLSSIKFFKKPNGTTGFLGNKLLISIKVLQVKAATEGILCVMEESIYHCILVISPCSDRKQIH